MINFGGSNFDVVKSGGVSFVCDESSKNEMLDIDYDKTIDKENIAKFKDAMMDDSIRFECVVCGENDIELDNGNWVRNAHKFLCKQCYKQLFNDNYDLFEEWAKR